MANSVYFDPIVGGDGSTVTDDDNPNTGLANGGAVIRIVPMFQQVVNIAKWVATQASSIVNSVSALATSAADSAASATASANSAATSAAQAAQQANTLTATSTTSVAISTGSKTFTTQSGEQFVAGQFVTIAQNGTPSNFMYGQVTSYSTTQLIVNVTATSGSGTIADWLISLSGLQGATGIQGIQGLSGATSAGSTVYSYLNFGGF